MFSVKQYEGIQPFLSHVHLESESSLLLANYLNTYKEFDSGLVALNVLTQQSSDIYTRNDYIQMKLFL